MPLALTIDAFGMRGLDQPDQQVATCVETTRDVPLTCRRDTGTILDSPFPNENGPGRVNRPPGPTRRQPSNRDNRYAMIDSVPMTREGYNKIRAEIDRLESVELPKITEKIAEAREEGDLKENAEYHAQRENQGMVMAKIGELKDKIARASIVDRSALPKDEVVFGSTVTVEDLAYGDEEVFTLVGAGEEDFNGGKIPVTSPFGQGLLGSKVGDEVEIEAPAGKLKFKILKIEFLD